MNRSRFNSLLLLPLTLLLVILPQEVYAQIKLQECLDLGVRCEPGSFFNISKFLLKALLNVLVLVGVVAFAALIYSGFLYVVSRGDEEQARRAKSGIVYTLVGLVVIGISGWLVNAVINLAK